MNTRLQPPPRRSRMELIDGAAIVVGYSLAAVLFRAFWPSRGVSVVQGMFAWGFYVWLGLAMSGPLLLLRKGTRPDRAADSLGESSSGPTASRTWAEMAWLLIGVYWIVLGVFVLPLRLQSFRSGDTILFGLAPVLATLVFRLFGPRATPEGHSATWTHSAAVTLLITWPVAWFCLIVVGREVL